MRAVLALVARTPLALAERLGQTLGSLAYRIGWRRQVAESQIAQSFPDRDQEWVRRTAFASFQHVGREMMMLPRLARGGLEEVRRWVEVFDGQEALQAALEEGRGCVVVSGHFGNWELAGSTLPAFGFPADAVMQRLKNRRLNRLVERIRSRLGLGLVHRAEAWDRLAASLAQGRVVAFVADQDARRKGIFVPFLGRLASTHRAPALLALRSGAPFFVGGAHRIGRRRYHAWAVRLEPRSDLGPRERVRELTRMWTNELERRIRLYPEQYFWHHKRWKTTPPGTASPSAGISSLEETV